MNTEIIRANSRGHLNFGWLDTYHTFSFGEYFDRNRMNFGALRVINDDYIKPDSMFPTHPHNNMEIITVVHSGTIEHQDSMGNWEKITAGEIQVMSAGSGITHSERNPSMTEDLNLFQIWIFPKYRDIKPGYDQKSFTDRLQQKNIWHTLVTPDGNGDSLKINQDAYISLAEFAQNAEIVYPIKKAGNGVFLMLINGEIQLDNTTLATRDAIAISETNEVSFKVLKNTRLIAIEVPMIFAH